MEKDLPKGWIETEFKEIVSFVIGGDWGKDIDFDFAEESLLVSCIRGSEIKKWDKDKGKTASIRRIKKSSLEKRVIKVGDILLEISGGGPDQPVGRVIYIDDQAIEVNSEYDKVCTNFLRLVRLTDELDKKYVKKYLDSFYLSGEIIKYQGGSNNLRNLKYKEFETIKIPLPPLAEQKRIVAKLDTLFASLENTKTRLEKIPTLLKNFKQAILTQAVTGKLTKQWREGKELEDVVPKAIELIRSREILKGNEDLINSGRRKQKITSFKHFGNNSFGWLLVDVESTCLFIVDCLHNTPKFVSEGYYVVDTTCITPFKINWEKARKVDSIFFKKWIERLKPSYGDVLFSREGTIGIAVKVPKGADLCIGQRMMLYRMGSFVTPEFAEIYFNSYAFRDEYRSHIKGVAAQHLNIGSIRALKFPIPSIKEQTEIVRRVESLFAKADAIEQQYQSLKKKVDTLPQALLAKAFRGELVAQNPLDEPASVLLDKIKAFRQAEVKVKPKRKTVRKKKSPAPVDL